MTPTISIIGATYAGNKGAAGMLTAAILKLKKQLPKDTSYRVFSLYPEKDRLLKQAGVEIVSLRLLPLVLVMPLLAFLFVLLRHIPGFRKIPLRYQPLRALAESDILLDLSGISFVDGRVLTLVYNVCCVLPALLVHVPVVKMSQALGPFNSFLNRRLAKIVLSRIELIFARGTGTSEYLRELGLVNWKQSADLAFLLDHNENSDTLEALIQKAERSVIIGVSPSQVLETYCIKAGHDYLGELSSVINSVADRTGAHVVILAHSNLGAGSRSRNNDYHVCMKLYELCQKQNTILLLDDRSPEELRSIISECDVFIASRFHSMISAICTHVPVMVTSWSHKYLEVMAEFGLDNYVAELQDITEESLAEMLTSIIDNRFVISQKMKERLPEVCESARIQIDEVVKLLSSRRYPKPGGTAKKLYEQLYSSVFRTCALGHSSSESIKQFCASGGLVSALLSERMANGSSDGALVANLRITEEGPVPETILVERSMDVYKYAGSIYSDFNHVDGILNILNGKKGRFDIVALPCQIRMIKKYVDSNEHIADRTGLYIGLWCGHATERKLLLDLLKKWHVSLSTIKSFRYRKGHWRGYSEIQFQDDSCLKKRFSRNYGLFQNLYVDCSQRCFSCSDHFAEKADISFGDCWLRTQKREKQKETMALSFSDKGDDAIRLLEKSDSVRISRLDPVFAVQAQKRAVIWHTFNTKARSKLAGIFKLNIHSNLEITPRINDYLAAIMILAAYRVFNSRMRFVLLRLPWWVLYPFMAVQKLMLNR